MAAPAPAPRFAPGEEVVASVVRWDGSGLADVAAVVVEALGPRDVLVRLVGFLPDGYQAGDVLPLDAARVRRPAPAPVLVRHRDGLVAFEAPAGLVARFDPDPDEGFGFEPARPDRAGWWVVCDDHAVPARDQQAAERQLAAVERLGACPLPHRVEYVVDPDEEVAS